MQFTRSIIETGVDRLVDLINKKGRIAVDDAAKEIGIGNTVVMEWADFLEEEGIIKIEYKFTKPFLVARKLAKKDIKDRAKEFSGKKDVFVRKAEVSLSFLNRESDKLKSLKYEFEKIKKDLGLDIGSIKNELEELKKYEQLKISLDKQVDEQRVSAMDKLEKMTKQVLIERKRYQNVLENIEVEEEELKKNKETANSIEKSERMVSNRLNNLRQYIEKIDSRVKKEEEHVKSSEENIQKLILMAGDAKARIEKDKILIDPLVEQSKGQTEKIKDIQSKIIAKITTKEDKIKNVKKASKKMKDLFKRKLGVLDIIEKLNKDRNALQKELIDLIRKARSFQLSSKNIDVGTEIIEIERKFKDVDNKKKIFEKELVKLSSFFK